MEGMIPRRQDCEDDRRSWRIAICRCDAAAHNFVAFSRKPFLRPLESSYKLSPHILELEMHSVVLRFTFCADAGMCQSLAVFRASTGLAIAGNSVLFGEVCMVLMRWSTVKATGDVVSGILNWVCPECGGRMGGRGKEFKCQGVCQTDWRQLWERVLSARR